MSDFATQSCWYEPKQSLLSLEQAALDQNLETGVVVIGAGISGLSVAYQLSLQGRSVVVLEDGSIGGGMSGRTSAHLSFALDDGYSKIESCHGREGAKRAAESHIAAVAAIETAIQREAIECQFLRVDGYLFNPPGLPDQRNLEDELEAARRAGVEVNWVERAPIAHFDTGRCLHFPNQGQFHPLLYLAGLTRAMQDRGVRLFTRTRVSEIEGGAHPRVRTASGLTVQAQQVVVATNTPVNDRFFVHTKQSAHMTYMVGLKVPAGQLRPALFWDTLDSYHYVRLVMGATPEGDDLLIVGGQDHKVGQGEDYSRRFELLEVWARERWPMCGSVAYRWSGEVFEPVDFQAFIGANPGSEENVFVVTGDSGHGLTHGTIAGLLLPELMAGRDHPWKTLYDPSRITPWAAKDFLAENLNTAAQYADWFRGGDIDSLDQLEKGCGAVLRQGMKKLACYRDEEGNLFQYSAVCPHLQGVVRWNRLEKTWDCPCHGSRFDRHGQVLVGPANQDLSKIT
ncbi:MAG: FAD-dependent oxidoreductase [Candidatus Eremiobacteraeota bacterium]|nr:FAD-dependent oxidoreductase [Candidatus Eremiobacteraeota bacterium]MCW5869870.1 FAD-dependent oxidoreductase [Candidatus Eremiobacteraeota bacterium]